MKPRAIRNERTVRNFSETLRLCCDLRCHSYFKQKNKQVKKQPTNQQTNRQFEATLHMGEWNDCIWQNGRKRIRDLATADHAYACADDELWLTQSASKPFFISILFPLLNDEWFPCGSKTSQSISVNKSVIWVPLLSSHLYNKKSATCLILLTSVIIFEICMWHVKLSKILALTRWSSTASIDSFLMAKLNNSSGPFSVDDHIWQTIC